MQMELRMTNACLEPSVAHLQDLASLIDAEYREMPGMRLTFAQVRRLWNLSNDECGRVLDYLVNEGCLTRDHNDRFCRDAHVC
jgi:hypothetical protein